MVETAAQPHRSAQQGFVLFVVLFAIAVPILLLALGTITISTTHSLPATVAAFDQERALSAALSGLDEALFEANSSTGLTSGQTVARTLGDGRSFSFSTAMSGSNLRVTCVGTFGSTSRTLRMDLTPESSSSLTAPQSSVSMLGDGIEVELNGSAAINGDNYNYDGSRGSSALDTYGMVVQAPDTLGDLTNMVSSGDRSKVSGLGSTPSFGVASSSIDLSAIKTAVQAAADLTMSQSSYNNLSFGNATTGSFQVSYRSGDVEFKGSTRGAGVLYVRGDLKAEGTFRFDGVIYVEGKVELQGNSTIYGALVVGGNSEKLQMEGNAKIYYSSQVLTSATGEVGGATRFTGFSGWTEITP